MGDDEEFQGTDAEVEFVAAFGRAKDFSPLMQAASAMHELVMEFIKAGFTRQEAIQIMLSLMANSGGDA